MPRRAYPVAMRLWTVLIATAIAVHHHPDDRDTEAVHGVEDAAWLA